MKILKTFFCALIFLLTTTTTQAQFFKKLQKKAEDKITREAEKRAERRVNKKIDKTFDKAETGIDGTLKKNPKKNTAKLPNTYRFDWKMTMQMQSKEGSIDMDYFLKQDANYFGMVIKIPTNKKSRDVITIMDMKNNTIITLMNMEGNKIMRVADIPNDEDKTDQNITIVETNTKKILGYLCQGYRIETEEGVVNMYVAMNAPVSFNKTLSGNSKFIPKGLNPNLLKKLKNGLMLELDFISKEKKKYNSKMICTSLSKNPFSIKISDYKSFGF